MTLENHEPFASTERLILRGFRPEDFEAYSAYRFLPVIYRYLYSDPPSAQVMRERFDASLNTRLSEDGDILRCAVVRREDDVLLGQISLKLTSKTALQAEVGYIFNPAYAGKGYATEAVRAIIDLGFCTFDLHRIFARLDSRNAGSIGVVERLGLRREAHLIENDRFNGVWGDEYIYAVLSREWVSRAGT
jgi:RimJ/RimL family protein N-acetyltransferase